MSIARIVEPELMLDPEQVDAYVHADFTSSDDNFIECVKSSIATYQPDTCLDIGCGPGNITFRLAQAFPESNITGIDGSPAMLEQARQLSSQSKHTSHIRFLEQTLPCTAVQEKFDLIVSNSVLHHLHDPAVLWESIKSYAHAETRVYIGDLRRPDNLQEIDQLTQQYVANEAEILIEDFRNSLHAAFTLDEVQQQLKAQDLNHLQVFEVDDRYLHISGIVGHS